MRPQQQNRRMRGRNNGGGGNNNNNNNNNNNSRRGPNPLTRNYESNGPDVKIRGSAQQIAEKYAQLARDAQGAGDRVIAENYLQHAEHYNRIIAAAQAQMPIQNGPAQRDNGDDDMDDERDEFDGNGQQGGEQRHGQTGIGQQPGGNNGGEQPHVNGGRHDQNNRQYDRNDDRAARDNHSQQPQAQPPVDLEAAPQPVIGVPVEIAAQPASVPQDAAPAPSEQDQPAPRRRGRPRRERRPEAGDGDAPSGEASGAGPALTPTVD